MRTFNCVMIGLSNPILSVLGTELVNNYFDYIDVNKTKEMGFEFFIESEPHITSIYGLNPIGYHTLSHILKVKNRKEYSELKSIKYLELPKPVINVFDNGDYKVLKIDFTNSPNYDLLSRISRNLCEYPNDWKFSNPYQPHITLTYLVPSAPESLAEVLVNKYMSYLRMYKVLGYLISGEEGSQLIKFD